MMKSKEHDADYETPAQNQGAGAPSQGNRQKLNEEMQKLYREEKINPMSGCLWSLIPFPSCWRFTKCKKPFDKHDGECPPNCWRKALIYEKLLALGFPLRNTPAEPPIIQIHEAKFISEFLGIRDFR